MRRGAVSQLTSFDFITSCLPFAHPCTQHDGDAAHARAGAAFCSACSFKLYYPCVALVLFVAHDDTMLLLFYA